MKAQVIAALEESMAIAPDPAEVRAGVYAGIERRRRRRGYTRIAVVVGVVALALLAVVPFQDDDIDPAAAIPAGTWPTMVELSFVPVGLTMLDTATSLLNEVVTYASDEAFLQVSVDNVDRDRKIDLPGWERVDVNGLPARWQYRPDLGIAVVQQPSGRWAQVVLRYFDGGLDSELSFVLRQVVFGLRENPGPALRVAFAPSYLPARQHIIGIGSQTPLNAGYGTIVVASGSLEPTVTRSFETYGIVDERRFPDLRSGVMISVHRTVDAPGTDFERIADIAGRPAFYRAGPTIVQVPNFHGGLLQVAGMPTPSVAEVTPLPELVKIAEGVRWLG